MSKADIKSVRFSQCLYVFYFQNESIGEIKRVKGEWTLYAGYIGQSPKVISMGTGRDASVIANEAKQKLVELF